MEKTIKFEGLKFSKKGVAMFYNLAADGKDNPIWSANTNNSCTRAPGAARATSKDQEYKNLHQTPETFYSKQGTQICSSLDLD